MKNTQKNSTEEANQLVLVSQYQNIQSKIVQSNKELDSLVNEINKSRQELSSLQEKKQKQLDSTSAEIFLLASRKELLLKENTNLENDKLLLQKEIVKLVKERNERIDKYGIETSSFTEKFSNMNKLIDNKKQILNSLECQLISVGESLSALALDKLSLEESISNKTITVKRLENEVEKLESVSKTFSDQLKKIESREKEADLIYKEVSAMHTRLKPKYIKAFNKFSNLK